MRRDGLRLQTKKILHFNEILLGLFFIKGMICLDQLPDCRQFLNIHQQNIREVVFIIRRGHKAFILLKEFHSLAPLTFNNLIKLPLLFLHLPRDRHMLIFYSDCPQSCIYLIIAPTLPLKHPLPHNHISIQWTFQVIGSQYRENLLAHHRQDFLSTSNTQLHHFLIGLCMISLNSQQLD
jgi:hypothetical protein